MNEIIFPTVVFLPIIFGLLIPVVPFKYEKIKLIYIELIVIITSILSFSMLMNQPDDMFVLFNFTSEFSVGFKLDGAGSIFVGLVSVMWPLATLYSFEYMNHEKHTNAFYMFYVITFGVTLGVALAKDILSLYMFYELLTMVTLPLIIHSLSRDAVHATRKYLYFSLGGAAFAFIGVVFVLVYGNTADFIMGGVFDLQSLGNNGNMLVTIFFLCFLGFSVKAALCPFSGWLPTAGVAPTPVTALLHAVAVVKAGVFACLRVTYYVFGLELVKGTWAQTILMVMVIFTIVYGCSRALKETHIKRRLAWSTVSNLSYILFGVVMMTPLGLIAAFAHMIFHGFMKITSFFCAGAIMHQSHKNYVHELDGLGRKMPITFVIFTISGLALMGVPGLCGFVSKWYLANAALDSGSIIEIIGVFALLVSALLTAIYMMTISVRAFFPGRDFDYSKLGNIKDPGWKMLLPLCIFVVVMVMFGVNSHSLLDYFKAVLMTQGGF